MRDSSVEVGWLTGSHRSDRDAEDGYRWVDAIKVWVPGQWSLGGRGYYGKGAHLDDWSTVVSWDGRGGAKGTVSVDLRQGACEHVPAKDLTDRFSQLTAARIDLAGDDYGARARPRDLMHGLLSHRIRSHVKKANRRLYFQADGTTGLELGAATSDRSLRCYDKLERHSVRTEVRLRRDYAAEVWALACAGWALGPLWLREVLRLGNYTDLPGFATFASEAAGLPVTPR